MSRRIMLHIDRLTLRGIGRAEAADVAAELQTELRRQLTAPGTGQAMVAAGDRYRIKAGRVKVAADGLAGTTGQAVAARIARTLKQ